jgi:hypothetical protein
LWSTSNGDARTSLSIVDLPYAKCPGSLNSNFIGEKMKYFFSLFVFIVALVTFVAGRYSIDREAVFMPSLPLAFLHSTQPIVMTVEVTIAEKTV